MNGQNYSSFNFNCYLFQQLRCMSDKNRFQPDSDAFLVDFFCEEKLKTDGVLQLQDIQPDVFELEFDSYG